LPARHPALDALHAETPVRVWSLLVTIFGDIVMREGRDPAPQPVATASLQELLSLLGVDANAMRAALSRLTKAGTLVRSREGRNTFYALSGAAAREFAAAAARIYDRPPARAADRMLIAAIHRVPDRAVAREEMIAQGWRFLGPATALRPDARGLVLSDGCVTGVADDSDELAAAARELWRIDALSDGYARFLALFAGSAEGVGAPADAAMRRVLLVHAFRRLVLRDPLLPAAILPADWKGGAARRAFDRSLGALGPACEPWLAANGFRAQT
jgi:phenylacetic acid degradation operon negative regulatory protein